MVRMKQIFNSVSMLVLAGALMITGALLGPASFAQDAAKDKQAPGKTETMQGTISDAMCGAKHNMADTAKCINACAGHAGYALVVGDKVYKLKGKTQGLDKLAGAKAKVTGTVSGNTITVESAEAAG